MFDYLSERNRIDLINTLTHSSIVAESATGALFVELTWLRERRTDLDDQSLNPLIARVEKLFAHASKTSTALEELLKTWKNEDDGYNEDDEDDEDDDDWD